MHVPFLIDGGSFRFVHAADQAEEPGRAKRVEASDSLVRVEVIRDVGIGRDAHVL